MRQPSRPSKPWVWVVALGLVGCTSSAPLPGDASTAGAGQGGAGGNQGGSSGGEGGAGGLSAGGGAGSGGLAAGCVDIVVSASTIGLPPEWSSYADYDIAQNRRLFWRDSRGVHFAWAPLKGDGSRGPLVVSSFDAATGALVGNHVFSLVPWASLVETAGMAPDETVALGGAIRHADGTYSTAVVLFKTDTFATQVIDLGQATRMIYHIAWDGEALAVHSQDSPNNVVEVTRLGTDGTVLLPWTPFALAIGYDGETDFTTDPVTGVSLYGASGYTTSVRGHTRQGTPLPTPNLGEFVDVLPTYEEMGKPWPVVENLRTSLAARDGGGFFVSWSGSACPRSTVVQPLGADLLPSSDTLGLSFPLYSNFSCESFNWLDALGNVGDLRLYGADPEVSVFHLTGGEVTRSVLVPAPAPAFLSEVTSLNALQWQGERWVGFFWQGKEKVARVVLDKEGCVYPANPAH